jgi:hypothetical protein
MPVNLRRLRHDPVLPAKNVKNGVGNSAKSTRFELVFAANLAEKS